MGKWKGRGEKHTPKSVKSMAMTTNVSIAARPATREPTRLAQMPAAQHDRKATKAAAPATGCSTNRVVGEGLVVSLESPGEIFSVDSRAWLRL